MGGCLSSLTKHTLITSDEPPKILRFQNRTVRKPSISEDFWTTSTRDMDNSAALSQGSISSISTSNQILDPHGGSGNLCSTAEFVNHGLLLWKQTRQHWTDNKKPENRAAQLKEPKLSWNATYDSLLGSNKPFRQPIPLPEMVDFLVDIWEQEGMYD